MSDKTSNLDDQTTGVPSLPAAVDRATFQAELDRLRVREKAHTREGDAIAAARRRLPMVEVDATIALIGPDGPLTLLDAFEGRRQLIAYYYMWYPGRPAPEQCEGCTWCTTQVAELSYLHSRDITYAVFCQGPYDESIRYRDFMGWDMPWYSAQALPRRAPRRAPHRPDAPRVLHAGRRPRLRDLLDDPPRRRGNGQQLRAHGPHRVRTPGAVGGLARRLATAGWTATHATNGRPIAQWSRLEAGPLRRSHRRENAMTTSAPTRPTAAPTNPAFVVQYLQVLAAMGIGMVVLGPFSMRVVHRAGAEGEMLLMATDMVVGMALWMIYRRHDWPEVVEMSAVMYASVAALFPFYWLGLLGPTTLMILGHILMLAGMAVAMLRRRRSRAARTDHLRGTRSR